MKRARNFLLTLFDIDKYEDLSSYLHHYKSLNYLVSAEEVCPKTLRKHIHIYCQFDNPVKFKVEKLCTAHVDKCKGTPQQCDAYVRKDGNILEEYGTLRKSGAVSVNDVIKMKPEERLELPLQYYNIINKINEKEQNTLNSNFTYKKMTVIYYWGLSGAGKTRSAIEYINKHGMLYDEVKFVNGFWNGIGSAPIALYDDFRDSHMKPSEFINFIDYYIHNLNIKGGNVKNHYTTILITSVQDPDYLWPKVNDESKVQWMRRMQVKLIEPTKNDNDSEAMGDRSAKRDAGSQEEFRKVTAKPSEFINIGSEATAQQKTQAQPEAV